MKQRSKGQTIAGKARILFLFLPAIIVMIIIYSFSAKKSVESTKDSRGITKLVYDVYETVSPAYAREHKASLIVQIEHIIRKLAHAFIYCVLSITYCIPVYALLYKNSRNKGAKKYLLFLLPIFFAFLYAFTDEFHQLFVEGRNGEFRDVMIDTLGAIIGAKFFLLFVVRFQHVHKKRNYLKVK